MTAPIDSATSVNNCTTKRIGLLILPQFSMMALAGASEPLRAANRLSGKTLYEWTLLTESGGPVSSSSGIEIHTVPVDQAPELDRVFVLASLDIEHQKPPKILRFLQRAASRGITVGALSTGTFILARAGLLEGKRCTLHWESFGQFSEEFPTIEVTRELYVNHDNRWTCAGGTAAIDLMLAQIALDFLQISGGGLERDPLAAPDAPIHERDFDARIADRPNSPPASTHDSYPSMSRSVRPSGALIHISPSRQIPSRIFERIASSV